MKSFLGIKGTAKALTVDNLIESPGLCILESCSILFVGREAQKHTCPFKRFLIAKLRSSLKVEWTVSGILCDWRQIVFGARSFIDVFRCLRMRRRLGGWLLFWYWILFSVRVCNATLLDTAALWMKFSDCMTVQGQQMFMRGRGATRRRFIRVLIRAAAPLAWFREEKKTLSHVAFHSLSSLRLPSASCLSRSRDSPGLCVFLPLSLPVCFCKRGPS